MKLNKGKFLFRMVLLVLAIAGIANANKAAKIVYPLHYSEKVYMYSQEYGVDPMLIFSIIKAESKFFPYAKSSKQAKGLMQIMDVTHEYAKDEIGAASDSIYDPDTNIEIGCWYVRKLSDDFDGNAALVAAAYNAGPSNVKSWLSDTRYSKDGHSLDDIPYGETEDYVKKVLKNYERYKEIYEN